MLVPSVLWQLFKKLLVEIKQSPFQAIVAATAIALVYRDCRSKDELLAQKARIADLSMRLASADKTIEVKENLYARSIREIKDLTTIINGQDGEISKLREQLSETGDRLLTAERLVIRWRKAYEGLLEATQTDEPGEDGVVRKRVDFKKDFGYIGVSGHTLTDPPEGYIVVTQLRPLRLVVGVAKGTDGQWRGYVESSEDDVVVEIDLAGIDVEVAQPKVTWRDRLWVDGYAGALGDKIVGLGASYRFDRYSVGVSCQTGEEASSCGLTLGFRPFR